MTKWFVVADKYRSQPDDPDDCVWTLSRNPDEIGWETDSGCPGYGLLKEDAEELAGAANRIEKLEDELHHCFHRINELQAALREIAYTEPEDKYWSGRIARKALEGKDD